MGWGRPSESGRGIVEDLLVCAGAVLLGVSALLFLRVYARHIRGQVRGSFWLSIAVVMYFILIIGFFLGYISELMLASALTMSTAVILVFGSVFVLATVVLVGRLFSSIRQVRCNQIDLLTGVFTKPAFEAIIDEMAQRDARALPGGTLVVMDLDDFKGVNDTAGHLKGDEILKLTANVIRGNLLHGEVCARFGGDEFVVFSPRDKSLTLAPRLEKMREDVRAGAREICPTRNVSLSLGRATFDEGVDYAKAFELADQRMYAEKRSPR